MNDKDTKLITELYNQNISLKKMFNHPAIQEYIKNPDVGLSDAAFKVAFDYYLSSGEMPYGVAKARSGDPYNWIEDRLPRDWEWFIGK